MDILAIESSCDETAAAVVRDGRRVLSSVVHSQVAEHGQYGGVVPEIASRRHVENIVQVVDLALQRADKALGAIDAIAVTAAPGLIGALLVGVNYAKGLAFTAKKPLVPVHHLRGHIAANYLAHEALAPPFLALVVSGGHSHIVQVLDYTRFHILGRTRDDAAGEAFDKAARAMGLAYPGGVSIDKITPKGNRTAFALPTPRLSGGGYDFSFSGLKTAVINTLHNAAQKGEDISVADLAASLNHKISEILCENLFAAAAEHGYEKIVAAGGVCANSLLRGRLESECAKKGINLYMPPVELCGDNAAMIGAQGYYQAKAGLYAGYDLNGAACMEIDDEF